MLSLFRADNKDNQAIFVTIGLPMAGESGSNLISQPFQPRRFIAVTLIFFCHTVIAFGTFKSV